MRGKLLSATVDAGNNGITPAGAGKTHIVLSLFRRLEDHPRRCGENAQTFLFRAARRGSPPQVRGKPAPEPPEMPQDRITPAGAGKTLPGFLGFPSL